MDLRKSGIEIKRLVFFIFNQLKQMDWLSSSIDIIGQIDPKGEGGSKQAGRGEQHHRSSIPFRLDIASGARNESKRLRLR